MEQRKLKSSIRVTHHRDDGDRLTPEEQERFDSLVAQGMELEEAKRLGGPKGIHY